MLVLKHWPAVSVTGGEVDVGLGLGLSIKFMSGKLLIPLECTSDSACPSSCEDSSCSTYSPEQSPTSRQRTSRPVPTAVVVEDVNASDLRDSVVDVLNRCISGNRTGGGSRSQLKFLSARPSFGDGARDATLVVIKQLRCRRNFGNRLGRSHVDACVSRSPDIIRIFNGTMHGCRIGTDTTFRRRRSTCWSYPQGPQHSPWRTRPPPTRTAATHESSRPSLRRSVRHLIRLVARRPFTNRRRIVPCIEEIDDVLLTIHAVSAKNRRGVRVQNEPIVPWSLPSGASAGQ